MKKDTDLKVTYANEGLIEDSEIISHPEWWQCMGHEGSEIIKKSNGEKIIGTTVYDKNGMPKNTGKRSDSDMLDY